MSKRAITAVSFLVRFLIAALAVTVIAWGISAPIRTATLLFLSMLPSILAAACLDGMGYIAGIGRIMVVALVLLLCVVPAWVLLTDAAPIFSLAVGVTAVVASEAVALKPGEDQFSNKTR
ncbi:MAG: hypothetical protein ACRCWS_08965 [Propionibacteriaceae bacterium]